MSKGREFEIEGIIEEIEGGFSELFDIAPEETAKMILESLASFLYSRSSVSLNYNAQGSMIEDLAQDL